jgi:hypothetical protein
MPAARTWAIVVAVLRGPSKLLSVLYGSVTAVLYGSVTESAAMLFGSVTESAAMLFGSVIITVSVFLGGLSSGHVTLHTWRPSHCSTNSRCMSLLAMCVLAAMCWQ